MMRIYNEWLAEFCAGQPERFAGLAAIPSHSIEAAWMKSSVSPRAGQQGSRDCQYS